ncbi:MAG: peptidoglycan DD-metalloendopeptidase family protein [Patescibacteria group bacterium]
MEIGPDYFLPSEQRIVHQDKDNSGVEPGGVIKWVATGLSGVMGLAFIPEVTLMRPSERTEVLSVGAGSELAWGYATMRASDAAPEVLLPAAQAIELSQRVVADMEGALSVVAASSPVKPIAAAKQAARTASELEQAAPIQVARMSEPGQMRPIAVAASSSRPATVIRSSAPAVESVALSAQHIVSTKPIVMSIRPKMSEASEAAFEPNTDKTLKIAAAGERLPVLTAVETKLAAAPLSSVTAATMQESPHSIAGRSFVLPMDKPRKTSDYGMRGGRLHAGVDLADMHRDKNPRVKSVESGTVIEAGINGAFGKYVRVRHGTDETGRIVDTEYAHLSRIDVRETQIVEQGQQIGLMGNTGASRGGHLHFGEIWVDGTHKNGRRVNPNLSLAGRIFPGAVVLESGVSSVPAVAVEAVEPDVATQAETAESAVKAIAGIMSISPESARMSRASEQIFSTLSGLTVRPVVPKIIQYHNGDRRNRRGGSQSSSAPPAPNMSESPEDGFAANDGAAGVMPIAPRIPQNGQSGSAHEGSTPVPNTLPTTGPAVTPQSPSGEVAPSAQPPQAFTGEQAPGHNEDKNDKEKKVPPPRMSEASEELFAALGEGTAFALALEAAEGTGPAANNGNLPVQPEAPRSGPEAPAIARLFTPQVVKQMLPNAPPGNIDKYLPLILDALHEFGLDDRQMVLFTLATTAPETPGFEPISERSDGSRYDPDPSINPSAKRRAVAVRNGNTTKGDGYRYRGRGFEQLTWKNSYRAYGDIIGVNLVDNPDLANDPRNAARIMAAFIKARESRIRAGLNRNDTRDPRAAINGGSNGLSLFTTTYQRGMSITDELIRSGQPG